MSDVKISRSYGAVWANSNPNPNCAVQLAGKPPDCAFGKKDLYESLRERTPDDWWESAYHVLINENDPLPIWDGAAQFIHYFGDEGAFACLPREVAEDIGTEMFEAAREAGFAVLGDFARQLVPVIRAIREFTS